MADKDDNMIALTDAIKAGAKAAREIGKSRERTFAIGEGLLALRSKVLIDMGKDPRVNDRSILKSGKYRELMGRALKTYPDYTLDTVFKNDSTRLAYMFVAEYKDQILVAFAEEEIRNPGATLRIVNPERIKSKFKSLVDPPKKTKAKAEAVAEAAAQDNDERLRTLQHDYDELFANYIDFDGTPADKLAELLLDSKAKNQGNRMRFINLIVEYATGKTPVEIAKVLRAVETPPKKERKRKAPKPDKPEPDLTIADGVVYDSEQPPA